MQLGKVKVNSNVVQSLLHPHWSFCPGFFQIPMQGVKIFNSIYRFVFFFSLRSINTSFIHFEDKLLGACLFLMVKSFFWIRHFSSVSFSMISSNTPSWNQCYLIIIQSLHLDCAVSMTHLLTLMWLQTISVFIFKVCLPALIYFAPYFFIQCVPICIWSNYFH